MKQLSGFELGYVVALYEGEGWFGLRKRRDANKIYACCSLKSTDEIVLHKLIYYLDVDFIVIKEKYSKQREHYKDAFAVTFNGKTAIELADQLYPYLSDRRQRQIDRMKLFHAMHLDEFEKNKQETVTEGGVVS